jgi:hypothetical protein
MRASDAERRRDAAILPQSTPLLYCYFIATPRQSPSLLRSAATTQSRGAARNRQEIASLLRQ